ncbi:MAG: BamA/OMP85 family outer membrane protein, partial [Gemmatimonadota bacterium]
MTGRLAGAPRTGARILIGATLAALAWVAPALGQDLDRFSVRVDSIAVHGNQRHSATEIVDRSGLRVGNIVQGPQVQDAIRRLFASGNFSDVQVSVSGADPEAAIFHIIVEERPTITSYEFEGLEHVNEGQVRDTIGLARNAPLDPDRIARARSLIVSRLSNEGFPKATVDTSIVPDPRSPGSFRVAFRVREGPRLGLTQIEFEGNAAFDDAEIRSAMVTDEEGFFWFDAGELKRDEYRRDLADRLPQFYARHGYLDFRVLDDTVIADPATGKGRVVVRVDEGPRYLLEELRIVGNRRFPTAQIQEIVRAAQGSPEEQAGPAPVNLPALEEASADLSDLYRNEGYLDALVQPDVRRLPASEAGADPRVVAVIDIREGNPTYIREIQIEGNTYTHDRIIRNRLFIFPSDIYSQDRLVRSVQAIQGLGFFEPLPPDQAVQFRDRPDGDMDVTLRVEEKQTGTLNFGVTASGITGFAGFIGYEQPNLFGQAKSGRFRWIFGRRQQDIEVAYSDPEILGSPYSGTIALRNSRDQFTGFSLGDRRQTGSSVEFGVPVFDFRSTRLFIGYSLFD